MPSTRLYQGEVTDTDIRLRTVVDDTPVVVKFVDIYLATCELTVESRIGAAVRLFEADAIPADVRLYEDSDEAQVYQATDIRLWFIPVVREEEIWPPVSGPTYYGILKYWTGTGWDKALLKVYTGSWEIKPLKRWTGSEWALVDATGV